MTLTNKREGPTRGPMCRQVAICAENTGWTATQMPPECPRLARCWQARAMGWETGEPEESPTDGNRGKTLTGGTDAQLREQLATWSLVHGEWRPSWTTSCKCTGGRGGGGTNQRRPGGPTSEVHCAPMACQSKGEWVTGATGEGQKVAAQPPCMEPKIPKPTPNTQHNGQTSKQRPQERHKTPKPAQGSRLRW